MSYSEFTFQSLRDTLALHLTQDATLFAHIEEVTISAYLQTTLQENVALALNINTEKARSEMIIAPMLIEVRKILHRQISLFSGVEFQVDAALGLNGVCDYIISKSTNQVYVSAPAVMIVEAKNENIKGGLAQCIAAMVAAQLFNDREGSGVTTVYGVVTTGTNWRFLKLEADIVYLDQREYYIDNAGVILGIFMTIVGLC